MESNYKNLRKIALQCIDEVLGHKEFINKVLKKGFETENI